MEDLKYKAPEKPEIEFVMPIVPDTLGFREQDRAEAIIKSLGLEVNSVIKESDDGEEYTINPRMVLNGTSPKEYKSLVDNVKRVLTKKEIYSITRYIRAKKENQKRRDEIYYSIQKRTDKFYKDYEVKEDIKDEEVKAALIELKKSTHGFNNTIYHLLSKDNDSYLICYKEAWFNRPIPNQQEWREEDDGVYRVLTDGEADRYAEDYYGDDDELWKQCVESGNTTLGFNDWVGQVINMDGRANALAGYDGREEYETINGTDYYIYRTN